MKYCRVTNMIPEKVEEITKAISEGKEHPSMTKSGCYQWINIFGGDIKYFTDVKENLEDYDVLHVNIVGKDVNLIKDIKELLPKSTTTQVVANLDYAPEETGVALPQHPHTLRREIRGADKYFATEPFTAMMLTRLVDEPVEIIPHPVPVKELKQMKPIERGNMITVLSHYYDEQIDVPYWTVSDMGMVTAIAGLEPVKRAWISRTLFDVTVKYTDWSTWIKLLQKTKIAFEPYIQHSYGRASAECAALGIPVVGSHLVDSMRRCFPDTIADPVDIGTNRKFIAKLRDDTEFYNMVSEKARENSEYYSFETTKAKFLRMVSIL